MYSKDRTAPLLSLQWITMVLFFNLLITLSPDSASAQETAEPTADAAASSTAESKYFDLRRSKERLTAQLAERYYNLVKIQEWGSDKGTAIKAKYVAHDPDLSSVTLAVVKGSGEDRTEKEVSVPVDRLNKSCQSRVKQIATIQKKLDDLIAGGATADSPGQPPTEPSVDPGSPMTDEQGTPAPRRRPTRRTPASREPRATATTSNAGSSAAADDGNPDPLGFGELPVTAVPPAVGPGGAAAVMPNLDTPPREAINVSAKPAVRGKDAWRTDYEAFRATLKVDESGEGVDWRAIPALRAAAAEVQKWEDFGSVGEEEHKKIAEKFAAVGDFSWEATLTDADVSQGDWTERLNLPPMPEPITISFVLEEQGAGDWQSLKAGDKVRFIGRFVDIAMGSDLVVAIRFPKEGSGAAK